MTDDCEAERTALANAFPEANIILCCFHVLQALWRWLWMGKNRIASTDRQHLFFLVKSMVYADTVENLDHCFQEATADPKVQKYPNFLKHVNKIYDRREEWATCYRANIPVRGNNTNNFCEAAMGVLKDKVLIRTKAFNILQLLDFIFTRLETYYERKIIDIANNRLDVVKMSRFMPTDPKIENIIQISDSEFLVSSETNQDQTYTVNITVSMCTCHVGCRGAPCKHQAAVVKRYNIQSCNFLPIRHPQKRQQLHYVATGQHLQLSWFATLSDVPEEDRDAACLEATEECILDASVEEVSSAREESRSASVEEIIDKSTQHAALLDEYHSVCQDIESTIRLRLQTDATFIPAVQAFIDGAKQLKNDSSLLSALSTFGRYSGHKVRNGKRNQLAGLKRIGVQPTAVARRKKLHVGGRKCDQRGRPCASSRHVTSKASLLPSVLPKKTRRPAPHNMKVCVAKNTGLGKTHGKK
ncbi:uncharacterized protein LOC117102680 [Anneissia japonica]|uniref:uncharacterized protein LOC117102680 n=1 Tax=Anneissia japonica TaxID=1529436 RepID=UPI001425A093|nr:uncharacterized protein LOC117102680 [Anneissia japonica]